MKTKIPLLAFFIISFISVCFAGGNIDEIVLRMNQNSITKHTTSVGYNPTRLIRRDEAAKMLLNFSNNAIKKSYTYNTEEGKCAFSDINESWSDLKDIIKQSCIAGYINGSKGKFKPKNSLTKAQAISIIVRIIDGVKVETGSSYRYDKYIEKAKELGILSGINILNLNSYISRGEIARLLWNSKSNDINPSNIPICIPEKLINVNILDIDDIVKNCTEIKKKEGKLVPIQLVLAKYMIYSGKIIEYDMNATGAAVVCHHRLSSDAKYTSSDKNSIPGYEVYENVFGKGIIDSPSDEIYPDKVFCKDNDLDCSNMIDYGGWQNSNNYFVAGYRGGSQVELEILYVIDDKVYNPGGNDYFPYGKDFLLKQSKWNFAGIKNNKIIVKRIKNGIANGYTEDINPTSSTFTLETCEIDM